MAPQCTCVLGYLAFGELGPLFEFWRLKCIIKTCL